MVALTGIVSVRVSHELASSQVRALEQLALTELTEIPNPYTYARGSDTPDKCRLPHAYRAFMGVGIPVSFVSPVSPENVAEHECNPKETQ